MIAGSVSKRGCVDASLYRRFRHVGLHQVTAFPQMAPYDDPSHVNRLSDRQIIPALTPQEATAWRIAMSGAKDGGTLIIRSHSTARSDRSSDNFLVHWPKVIESRA